jgi:uncharacterized membrane protein HdeD (DUF308 family)
MSTLIQSFQNTIKHWYIPLIVGILFMVFGFYLLTIPLETYLALSVLFSISFITSGLLEIIFSIQNKDSFKGWGWYLVSGIFSLIMGMYLVANPAISMTVLPFVVGFTLMFRSFQALGFAFDLSEKRILSWGNLALAGTIGIIFSFLLLANPFFASLSLVSLTALTFIFTGISSMVLAFNLKSIKDAPNKMSPEVKNRIEGLEKELTDLYNQK